MSQKTNHDDFLNKRFGQLLIIKDLGNPVRDRTVLATCDCGKTKSFLLSNIRSGKTTSCGCFSIKNTSKRSQTHGLSKHPLYWVYKGIVQRCYNPNDPSFKYYGGRGVTMCKEWLDSVTEFYDWAIENGWEKGLEIDKDIKGDGLIYSPETCSIVTTKQNTWRRKTSLKVEYNGQIKCVAEWATIIGLPSQRIYKRLGLGYSVEDAFYDGVIKYNRWNNKKIKKK